jgi:hypothetical protein
MYGKKVIILIAILSLIGNLNAFDLPERFETELEEYANSCIRPFLTADPQGNLHLLFSAQDIEKRVATQEIRYCKYDVKKSEVLDCFIKDKMGNLNADARLFVSENGYIFCTYGFEDYYLLLLDDKCNYVTTVPIGGHPSVEFGVILPTNKILLPSGSDKGAFYTIDTVGNIEYIGSGKAFWKERGRERAYLSRPIRSHSYDGHSLIYVGLAVDPTLKEGHKRIDYGKKVGITMYDLEAEKITRYKQFILESDPGINCLDVGFEGFEVYFGDDGRIDIFTGIKQDGESDRMYYFTIDTLLNIQDRPQMFVVKNAWDLPFDSKEIRHQKFLYIHPKEPGKLGHFMRYSFGRDKVYISESRELRDGVYYKKRELWK